MKKELLKIHFQPKSEKLAAWAKEPYQANLKYPEQLLHKCAFGLLVRSKSEAMIASALYAHKIPFRYECELCLDDKVFYPDFTIRHPVSGEVYYWEHFGMMDQPAYSKNACSKLQIYTSHGIIPSIHLITPYVTKEYPLTNLMIEDTIQHYFVDSSWR